jgi:hypothetical protein
MIKVLEEYGKNRLVHPTSPSEVRTGNSIPKSSPDSSVKAYNE